jgi:3-dehydroquinate dehydratase-2
VPILRPLNTTRKTRDNDNQVSRSPDNQAGVIVNILIINGPNLNMLGNRDTSQYGSTTLQEIETKISEKAQSLGVKVEFFQSNHEGAIVDYIQSAASNSSGIVINPGALTHYGLSLRDALVDSTLPVVEIHLSNIHGREQFRRNSVMSSICIGQIAGLGWKGYIQGLDSVVSHINSQER